MAQELREARNRLRSAHGDDSLLCEICRPGIDGHKLRLGLVDRVDGDFPNCGIKLSEHKLDVIIQNASRCWVCGWLLLLAQNRVPDLYDAVSEEQRSMVGMGIESQMVHTFEQGRTFSDAHNDQRRLVRMEIYWDSRPLNDLFREIIHNQHSDALPPQLIDLLDQGTVGRVSDYVAFTTRLRPQTVDPRLFAWWKEQCQTKHEGQCNHTTTDEIKNIRLIDTQQDCNINVREDVNSYPWVALSYCWGGPQVHCLTTANQLQYQTPGGLRKNILPSVIQDAIELTKAIGERYLWIDSLCMVQDDDLDKASFLPIMDSIYEQAAITIVNAATSSVNDPLGLPGIGTPDGRRKHEIFEINGSYLTEALDPGYSTYGSRGILANSTWNSRGWTFQEQYLSRRSLIFTPDQVYWQCQRASWCEGSFWERFDDRQIFRHCFGDNVLGALFEVPRKTHWVDIYLSIMKAYQIRTFSTDDDRLHGLAGVLKVLTRYGDEQFIWGVPQSRLEQGLTFTADFLKRRRDISKWTAFHKTIDQSGSLVSCPFPTWSWLGWAGAVGLESIQRPSNFGTIGLQFYGISLDESMQRLDVNKDPPVVYPEGDNRRFTQYPPNAQHAWMDKTHQVVTIEDIPANVLSSKDLAPSLLCFYTCAATLQIESLGPGGYYREMACRLSHGDVKFMSLWPGVEKDFEYPAEGKFIIVGVEKERMSRGGNLMLKLLFIEEDKDLAGVYRRKALLTTVYEKEWDNLSNGEWELILLA